MTQQQQINHIQDKINEFKKVNPEVKNITVRLNGWSGTVYSIAESK